MDLHKSFHNSSEENQHLQEGASQGGQNTAGNVQRVSLSLSINFYEIEEFKLRVSKTLIEIIKLELEGLPEHEWQRTIQTWKKICAFCKNMMKKSESERHEFYKKSNFDTMMVQISESVVEMLQTAYRLGLMKEKDPPERLIELGLERVEENSKAITTLKSFFLKG